MKIFVVTFNDCVVYGLGTASVKVFTNKEDAYRYMEAEYLEKCEKEKPCPTDCQLEDNYAYISDMYYWDIFEEEI